MSDKQLALVPSTIILGERNYAEAIDLIITKANQRLLIFDQDFSLGEFASLKRYNLIKSFLIQSPNTQLNIILHNSDYLTKNCPRLFSLLEKYGHKMTVHLTNHSAKVAKDCFILADDIHYIRRIHVDHARFKFAFDDAETTASLMMRFNELKEEAYHTLTTTQIGL